MKFFEAVPSELFSPLASPNRILYADALDVLYATYQENLKIREDVLYSMLRGRLEQELADATFEDEDINEEELRDISGRARFLSASCVVRGGLRRNVGMILKSISRFLITAAACWNYSTNSAMIARLVDIPMCSERSLH